MSATDLMPSIHALPRREKFWIVQELLADLAHEEPFSESEYPIWSPYEAHSAAASLIQLLEQDKAQPA